MATALVVGASSGIGKAIAERLARGGWGVIGVARRPSTVAHAGYRHVIADVQAPEYRDVLIAALEGTELALCIYAAGIGHAIDLATFAGEAGVFATNLLGVVITAEVIIPRMVAAGAGHFIGLSSQADRVIDDQHPSYAASKAGMSSYLEGLAIACRPRGVAVTNLRFGFVDTAMSRDATTRPFLITAERAAEVIERALARRPMRVTYPWRMAVALWLIRWPRRIRLWLS